jgi:hypothetical protein
MQSQATIRLGPAWRKAAEGDSINRPADAWSEPSPQQRIFH